jgi:hypothetical protein
MDPDATLFHRYADRRSVFVITLPPVTTQVYVVPGVTGVEYDVVE